MTAEDPAPDPTALQASAPDAPPVRPIPLWLCLLAGIASALVGLFPWLVTGMRLPLQNLWATATLPEDMPIALLPFSQYAVTRIIGLIVVGSVVAGIAARATRARRPRFGALTLFAGVLVVQVVAVAQTAAVVQAGLRGGTDSVLYLGVLAAVAVLAVLVGAGAYWLVASAPEAGALVGLSVGALALGPWLSALLAPLGALTPDWALAVLGQTRWVVSVLVGIAIAWCGVRSVGRVLAAVLSLALVWVVPALETAIANALGNRIMSPAEMLDYGILVFRMALTMPELALPPVVVAVVVAAIGLAGKLVARRRLSRARTA